MTLQVESSKHRRIERGFLMIERGFLMSADRDAATEPRKTGFSAQNRIVDYSREEFWGIWGRTDSRNKRGGFVPRARKKIPPDFVISRCGKHDPTRSATVRLS